MFFGAGVWAMYGHEYHSSPASPSRGRNGRIGHRAPAIGHSDQLRSSSPPRSLAVVSSGHGRVLALEGRHCHGIPQNSVSRKLSVFISGTRHADSDLADKVTPELPKGTDEHPRLKHAYTSPSRPAPSRRSGAPLHERGE